MKGDTVIIGAGLSGLSAALSAVSSGCSVIVVSQGAGNFTSSSGYIEILGYFPTDGSSPLENPCEAISPLISENPLHPYAFLGVELIKEGVSCFTRVCEEMDLGYEGAIDRNILMPAASGALLPAAFVPRSSHKSILDCGELIVAGIVELMDFYPHLVSSNLSRAFGRDVKPLYVSLGLNTRRALSSFDIASTLEKGQTVAKLIKELKGNVNKGSALLMPAVLGKRSGAGLTCHIEQELECRVLEIPTLPPAMTGFRLGEALREYLLKIGVEFITGGSVVCASIDSRRCREIQVKSSGGRSLSVRGESFVLATGGILGGGLEVCANGIRETVFGLPASFEGKNPSHDFFCLCGHPLTSSGVKVNENLQPVREGEILIENLHVAGSTLYGYDPYLEKSGSGVAISTGYAAGLRGGKNG